MRPSATILRGLKLHTVCSVRQLRRILLGRSRGALLHRQKGVASYPSSLRPHTPVAEARYFFLKKV
jgi:hypothetical protein